MMRWSVAVLFASLSLVCLGATSAHAETCGGVELPDAVEVDGSELKLNGLGLREATMFSVDVYVAGLYLEDTSGDRSGPEIAASNSKKRLIMHFVRGVGKDDIVEAYRESFKTNGGDAYGSIKSKVDELLGWMSSIEEGQKHVYTYVPGEGVTIEVKGKTKGTIEGEKFAEIFYKIWLGDPPNAGLKRGLLGGTCG